MASNSRRVLARYVQYAVVNVDVQWSRAALYRAVCRADCMAARAALQLESIHGWVYPLSVIHFLDMQASTWCCKVIRNVLAAALASSLVNVAAQSVVQMRLFSFFQLARR